MDENEVDREKLAKAQANLNKKKEMLKRGDFNKPSANNNNSDL